MRVLPLEGHRSVVDGDNIVAVRGLYKIVHFASNMLTVLQLTYPLGPLNMATQFALLITRYRGRGRAVCHEYVVVGEGPHLQRAAAVCRFLQWHWQTFVGYNRFRPSDIGRPDVPCKEADASFGSVHARLFIVLTRGRWLLAAIMGIVTAVQVDVEDDRAAVARAVAEELGLRLRTIAASTGARDRSTARATPADGPPRDDDDTDSYAGMPALEPVDYEEPTAESVDALFMAAYVTAWLGGRG